MHQKKNLIYIFLAVVVVMSGCSVPEPVTEREPGPVIQPMPESDREISEEPVRGELEGFERTLFDYRSRLSDQFSSITHDIPETFQGDASAYYPGEEIAGYRVQIYSTRDIAAADSTLDEFRVWAANNLAEDSNVEVYIYFRQPYYRVRAGDFIDRNRAIEFARVAKQQYPDAWVVHDRINPESISD